MNDATVESSYGQVFFCEMPFPFKVKVRHYGVVFISDPKWELLVSV